ncbi:anti-sigma regulatory factor (Ser/Thr protein kinase) [Streptosporangium becharense]|uniref:Anti-sigma regulatory factor (Ser/Thr protein kinase) n=1 Tax=Streptosporangium becharense TaxID=1816182 RepID=A0A7W9IMY2_9ACTN|nr:ATP-binding protein [Streptosporangium becharense]MBB2910582.1 anti-sigma regulatory factor (Ser/Thr protein kinase) [Streptosporangium becharense]MBB5823325.1 anti-sigma regulatory factor (Ser/Thr protein kinase) [Streptosporangium becharense]
MSGFRRKDVDGESEVLGKACLELDPASASKARAYVREWIGADHPAYEDVRLAASELVANAVLHTCRRNPGDLVSLALLRRAGLLHVAVTDPGGGPWEPEAPRAVPDDEERGRGLGIVGELSRWCWGVLDHADGSRTVWCVLGGHAPGVPCG